MRRILIVLVLAFLLAACGTDAPAETAVSAVEVTREVPVEVTRLVEVTKEVAVEVEVTRLVEQEVVVTATLPPTPLPTNTPPGPVLGERGNPYPVGQTAVLTQGGSLEFELAVQEVIRGEAALQRIQQANQFNDPPPEGFEFVLVYVEVSYTGADEGMLEIGKFDTSVVTNGRVIAYSDTFTYSPCCLDPEFEIALLSGGTAGGWLALPTSLDDPAPLLLLGDSLYFSLTPVES